MVNLNFPGPVSSEEDFFDREHEWQEMQRVLLGADPAMMIIIGERRIGKTSLQLVAARRMAAGGTAVPVHLPFGPSMKSSEEFAGELLFGLRRLSDPDSEHQAGPLLESFGEFTAMLRENIPVEAEPKILVCVDEFDQTLRNCAERDDHRLAALVMHLTFEAQRSGLPLNFLFTMAGVPEGLQLSFSTPFISTAFLIELQPFTFAEMAEMVLLLLGDTAGTASLEKLFAHSGGHPYVTKLILDRLLEPVGYNPERLDFDRAAIEQAVREAVIDPHARNAFGNVYNMHLGNPEKALMLLMAEGGLQGVTMAELEACGAEYITAAKTLARRGYLEPYHMPDSADPAREQAAYRYRIPFFGSWLRSWERYPAEAQRRLGPIWSVLADSRDRPRPNGKPGE